MKTHVSFTEAEALERLKVSLENDTLYPNNQFTLEIVREQYSKLVATSKISLIKLARALADDIVNDRIGLEKDQAGIRPDYVSLGTTKQWIENYLVVNPNA